MEALPGIIGTIISWILNRAEEVVAWLSQNWWTHVTGVGVFIYTYFMKKMNHLNIHHTVKIDVIPNIKAAFSSSYIISCILCFLLIILISCSSSFFEFDVRFSSYHFDILFVFFIGINVRSSFYFLFLFGLNICTILFLSIIKTRGGGGGW